MTRVANGPGGGAITSRSGANPVSAGGSVTRRAPNAVLVLLAAAMSMSPAAAATPSPAGGGAAERAPRAVSASASRLPPAGRVYAAPPALDTPGLEDEPGHYSRTALRACRLAGGERDDSTRRQIQALREQEVKL